MSSVSVTQVLLVCGLAPVPEPVSAAVAVAAHGRSEEQRAVGSELEAQVEHHFAVNGEVKIHYVTAGPAERELVLLLHGYPDYWYTWRHVMEELRADFQVAALDLRGYNRSDKPSGVDAYAMRHLLGDVAAVIRDLGRDRATIVGHDWGAAIAWQFSMQLPAMTERLVILSVPHPSGFLRELTSNEAQKADSQYAREFQKERAHESLTATGLASWVREEDARAKYVEAFERSDFQAMLNYYKANYPRTSGAAPASAPAPSWPPVQAPVLVFHGQQDRALHARGHANTWEHVEGDMTLVMIRDAGHWVHHDARELVTTTLHDWLLRTMPRESK